MGNMRVLVTGAGGFIGSHVVARLTECADVLAVRRAHAVASPSPTHRVIAADLSVSGWTNAMPAGIHVVIHLAQSRAYRQLPGGARDVYRVNVDSTFELLEWSRQTGVRHFIFASTGSVYRPQDYPLSEDAPTSPASFYPASKLAAETLCASFAAYFRVTILRLFGVYGPGISDGVLPRLMHRVARSEPITLDGGLGLVTTPTYIEDCVAAIESAAESPSARAGPRVLNVCGDEEISLRDACITLGDLLQKPAVLVANDKSALRLSGDNARLKAELSWSPQWSLRAGLARLANRI